MTEENDDTVASDGGFNNWADTVEDRLAKLQTRTLVSAGIGAAGLGVGVFAISLIGKLGKTLGEIAQVTNAISGAMGAAVNVDVEAAKEATQPAQDKPVPTGTAPYIPRKPDTGIDETIPTEPLTMAEPYDPGPMQGPSEGSLPPVIKENDSGIH